LPRPRTRRCHPAHPEIGQVEDGRTARAPGRATGPARRAHGGPAAGVPVPRRGRRVDGQDPRAPSEQFLCEPVHLRCEQVDGGVHRSVPLPRQDHEAGVGQGLVHGPSRRAEGGRAGALPAAAPEPASQRTVPDRSGRPSPPAALAGWCAAATRACHDGCARSCSTTCGGNPATSRIVVVTTASRSPAASSASSRPTGAHPPALWGRPPASA
jgi:hypothetical protein